MKKFFKKIKRRKLESISVKAASVLIVFLSLAPFFWIVLTSLKKTVDAFAIPPVWIFQPTLTNYATIFYSKDFLLAYKNSLIVSLSTTAISLILGIFGGYGLARTRGKGNKMMGLLIILSHMAPPLGFLIPLYMLLTRLGLRNTYLGLDLTFLTLTVPLVVWIMNGVFSTIPLELEEAAKIDGCSQIRILFSIDIPLALPGIVTAAIFSFIISWNIFLYPLIIAGAETKTCPLIITGFSSFAGVEWGKLTAAGTLITIPVLIFSLFAQKGLIRGFMGGAIR